MKLEDLADLNWKSHERKRFLNDDTKSKTDKFDPESFKHDGFENRKKYLDKYVPGLAEQERLRAELSNFTPPRLSAINGSPYQALVIRYGILRTLIRQPGFNMEKESLIDAVQNWQKNIIEEYDESDFVDDDELFHLSRAAVNHGNDVDDSELHMIFRYFELHNKSENWKHQYYTWEDIFYRLSAIDRFPKVSRSEKPEHALDTIEKGLWSLQEQAVVYEIVDEDRGDVVGLPEEYKEFVSEWLHYEISDENYLKMLESLNLFDKQSVLVKASGYFEINMKNQGLNENRRKNIVKKGVYPSNLFREILTKEDLKSIVDEYGIDAHKQKTEEMISKTIEYFEESQRRVETDDPTAELYLEFYEEISNGTVEQIPPQLQGVVSEEDTSKKLEVIFEKATAEIFKEVFNLKGTKLLGQQASGSVADGETEQNGTWLLWDNKRRVGNFKLGSTTRSKIKDYIDTKSQQHDVQWFLIIAPEFSSNAVQNADLMEKQLGGVDIRLVRSADFKELAQFWRESLGQTKEELPLSMFNGSNTLDIDTLKTALEAEFS